VLGTSVEEATVKAIKLETLARVNWMASQPGRDVPTISAEDQEVYRASVRGGRGGVLPVWRYYVTLLERGCGPSGLGPV
jgi:hypothetical protein